MNPETLNQTPATDAVAPSGSIAAATAQGTEAEVCADICRRQQFGLQKYGVSVEESPLSLLEWLKHAYAESLDLPIYLKRSINEIESQMQHLHQLLAAYRTKRQCDGLNGRKWHASKHYEAEKEIVRLESLIDRNASKN